MPRRFIHDRIDVPFVQAAREARKGLRGLGPGLVTGVADDDPSGISTYTIAGAQYGYQLLWTSLLTLPMNFAVQTICARIGIVTGRGLAEVIGGHYGRRWLFPVVGLLFIANVVNIGADIGAVAAAVHLLFGAVPTAALVIPIGAGIALLEVVVDYERFARILKVLTLVLFAYVAGAFVAGPDWGSALRGTFAPTLSFDGGTIGTIVAILGTTISPYLFFWQTSEEVEEEQSHRVNVASLEPGQLRRLLRAAGVDVGIGMALANVGFYFVVLTAAAALWNAGQTDIKTAADAAEALRPLAGDQASLLFAIGIIGTGLLAIPVLATSVAYATAEVFGWEEGLTDTFRQAPQFYGTIALATVIGMGIVFSPLPEIKALYFAAIVNGAIAPVILGFIMVSAHDRRLLGEHVPGKALLAIGWFTTAAMAVAAIALAVSLIG